jgi:hypothetical protein
VVAGDKRTLKTEQYKQKQAYHSRNWMAQKFRLIT